MLGKCSLMPFIYYHPNTENQHIYPIREANLPMMNWSGKNEDWTSQTKYKKEHQSQNNWKIKEASKKSSKSVIWEERHGVN